MDVAIIRHRRIPRLHDPSLLPPELPGHRCWGDSDDSGTDSDADTTDDGGGGETTDDESSDDEGGCAHYALSGSSVCFQTKPFPFGVAPTARAPTTYTARSITARDPNKDDRQSPPNLDDFTEELALNLPPEILTQTKVSADHSKINAFARGN